MPLDAADIPMSGTPEQAFERLAWLQETQDAEVWATPSAYTLCRRLFECWPPGRAVPFFYPNSGAIEIDDDENCAAIRVGPAGVALITWDWTTDDHSEQYTSLDRATLQRILPRWLDIIDQAESYEDWRAKQAAERARVPSADEGRRSRRAR